MRDFRRIMLVSSLCAISFGGTAIARDSDQLPSELMAHAANPRDMVKLRREGVPPPPASLADVAWLEGSWTGEMPFGPVEQTNLPARFSQMPGFVRATNGRGVVFYELTLFAEINGSLTARVKHFTPALAGWEAQDEVIDRPLVAKDAVDLYFDGITYRRTGPNSYIVYFLNRENGQERDTLVIPFHRNGSARQNPAD